jgi:hypothetical protein
MKLQTPNNEFTNSLLRLSKEGIMIDPKDPKNTEGVNKSIPGADGEANMGQDAPGPIEGEEAPPAGDEPANPDAGQTEGN